LIGPVIELEHIG